MNGSRRLGTAAIGVAIALAWSAAATPGLARSVTNSSGSNMTAQVAWGTGDETGAGHYGGIYGDMESGGTIVGLFEQDAIVVTCDNGTPGDLTDDFMGYVGTFRDGQGAGSVTIASNLQSASVTGLLALTTVQVNYCTGQFDVISTETDVPVVLELVAISQPMPSVDTYHELLASVYNMHQNIHVMSRYATGTAMLGGEPYAFDSGLISHNHWTDHQNSS